VPEPTTWAMLVMGFGLVGAGMRRRSRAIAA
jgi:PEP-CTERM motif